MALTTTGAADIVAAEQILRSLMQEANAELIDAIERQKHMYRDESEGSAYTKMTEDIVSFRTDVIEKIKSDIAALDGIKKNFAGISDFTWRDLQSDDEDSE